MDTLLLSRIQFGANISFHILFPTITIALGWMLLFFKLRFNATGDQKWMDAYIFWVKVFALSFAMGVVSGITMSFQFGTNWPGFMETVGNVAGPLLAYEIMTAFFLEAVFLGIMLFGVSRVKPWVHTLATFLVAFGTTMSTFWIIVLNSWMHTPQGYELRDGVVFATNWFDIIFNPSMPYRFVHMLLASGLTVAFLIAGISALRMLWGDKGEDVKSALRVGIIAATALIPIQILAGNMHGLNTLEHQPAKIAAMEGNWETGPNTPLVLFATPDQAARESKFEIGIPNGASLILKHKASGVVPGLNDFIAQDGTVMHPRVAPVFFSFRIMIGTGVAMLLLSSTGLVLLRKYGAGHMPRMPLYALCAMSFSGWIATLAGWYTTEIGRQPWLVQGVLMTKDAVSDVSAGMVLGTLIGYLVIYVTLIFAYIGVITYLARKATKGESTRTRGYPRGGEANVTALQPGE
jgi:cytochrome d ubiquinol oxidase subunit I